MNSFVMIVLAFVATFALHSCSSSSFSVIDMEKNYDITLQRTACRGNCPVYSLSAQSDGTIVYEGFLNVQQKGKRIGKISADSVSAVLKDLHAMQFETMPAEFTHQNITDMPTVIFTVMQTNRGEIRGRKILDYQGDKSTPSALREIYKRMDGWMSLIQWQE